VAVLTHPALAGDLAALATSCAPAPSRSTWARRPAAGSARPGRVGVVWQADGLIRHQAHVARADPRVVTLPDGRSVGARLVVRDPGP
jgi:S1-C subfamily serine protease